MEVQYRRCLFPQCQNWKNSILECLKEIMNLQVFFVEVLYILQDYEQTILGEFVSLASIKKLSAPYFVRSICFLFHLYHHYEEPDIQFYQIA